MRRSDRRLFAELDELDPAGWEIQGNYGQGWEVVTVEETRVGAVEMLECYHENEPEFRHRIRREMKGDRGDE
jgi:hypothetical protein